MYIRHYCLSSSFIQSLTFFCLLFTNPTELNFLTLLLLYLVLLVIQYHHYCTLICLILANLWILVSPYKGLLMLLDPLYSLLIFIHSFIILFFSSTMLPLSFSPISYIAFITWSEAHVLILWYPFIGRHSPSPKNGF